MRHLQNTAVPVNSRAATTEQKQQTSFHIAGAMTKMHTRLGPSQNLNPRLRFPERFILTVPPAPNLSPPVKSTSPRQLSFILCSVGVCSHHLPTTPVRLWGSSHLSRQMTLPLGTVTCYFSVSRNSPPSIQFIRLTDAKWEAGRLRGRPFPTLQPL